MQVNCNFQTEFFQSTDEVGAQKHLRRALMVRRYKESTVKRFDATKPSQLSKSKLAAPYDSQGANAGIFYFIKLDSTDEVMVSDIPVLF
ncbi:hypothetical protein Y032_0737g1946 [Ancylostoma ceylanicum]|uniref:Uncharacterized protein n=1 Tax=Ancylostoma ceylanicum TaxID=53326 RepID=A0A016WEB7_9BILA|nr:hypothetical protein Y032_0737g1946 [Ancylostoma ceylanicum]